MTIEAPCRKLQGIFEVYGSKEAQFPCCSLTPQQAAENALAMHFQPSIRQDREAFAMSGLA